MTTVRKRGKTYYIDYTFNGKRIRKSVGTSKKVADLIKKDIELKIAREDSGLFIKDISVKKFIQEYDQHIKSNLRPRSYSRYRGALRQFEKFLPDHIVKLSQITPGILEDYKAARKETLAIDSVNTEIKVLKNMFRLARDYNYIRENPMAKIKRVPQLRNTHPRFFSREDASVILGMAEQPYKDIFTVLLYTGMRRDELRFLEASDIDLKRNRIKIHRKPGFTPKTGEREIPIPKKILPILKRRMKHGVIFKNPAGDVYAPERFYKELRKILEKTGIRGNIHTFRHTFISWLLMEGADLRSVQLLAGHSDITTTQRYAHVSQAHIDKVIDFIR